MSRAAKGSWKCLDCKSYVACTKGDLAELLKHFEEKMNEGMRQALRSEIGEQVKRLETKITSIETSLLALESKHDVVQRQLDDISRDLSERKGMGLVERVDKLELDIAAIRSSTPGSGTLSPSGFQLETIMSEMKERQRRANNLIFHDVPESTAESMAARINDEIAYLNNGLAKLNVDLQDMVVKTSRIGKPDPSKVRPLLVTMRDSSAVSRVLSSNRKANPRVLSVTSDNTPAQHKYMAELRLTLREKQDRGETDITIKYVSGVPTIVPSATHPSTSGGTKTLNQGLGQS
ncbi:hypothetical protein GE061_002491 [Apolygus lucorum]|uniref:Uncharacterized protein n=1 Tax=Apolygus lucorum TaxID=248454 RepID=A0A8S9X745_APOLU|nr:hypothetical protein GE061_002491 [Apolygus lucorum]